MANSAPCPVWPAPCDVDRHAMACIRPTVVLGSLLVTFLTTGRADADELREFEKHVRTTDVHVRDLVREAVDTSPSFRTLVARLVRSDLIVYVMCERVMPPHVEGQITFITAAGGVRSLAIRVRWGLLPRRYAATIAHELQHAVEIADAPWVVDEETLAREYERIGVDQTQPNAAIRAFDSGAAILAGEKVWREYGD